MYVSGKRAAWVELSKENLLHNIDSIKRKIGENREIYGTIKADGYGHGAVFAARALLEKGITTFGVATLDEAIELRENKIPGRIIIQGITPSFYAPLLLDYNLTAIVSSLENAQAFSDEGKRRRKNIDVFIAIDTGMGRVGFGTEDFSLIADIKRIAQLERLNIMGLFSHFATADSGNKDYARRQESTFNSFYRVILGTGMKLPVRTIANSAAVMEMPSTHLEAVRPGIALYGCYPSEEVNKANLDIRPVMSVKANIVHVKKIPAGATVSYGQKFVAKRESVIGTLTLGYADGYPRAFSNQAKVIVNGKFAPIAGNICMDQCMVDLTDVPGTRLGDEVILMGSDGKLAIRAEDIAKATGTINYEILCGFGQRLPKIYV